MDSSGRDAGRTSDFRLSPECRRCLLGIPRGGCVLEGPSPQPLLWPQWAAEYTQSPLSIRATVNHHNQCGLEEMGPEVRGSPAPSAVATPILARAPGHPQAGAVQLQVLREQGAWHLLLEALPLLRAVRPVGSAPGPPQGCPPCPSHWSLLVALGWPFCRSWGEGQRPSLCRGAASTMPGLEDWLSPGPRPVPSACSCSQKSFVDLHFCLWFPTLKVAKPAGRRLSRPLTGALTGGMRLRSSRDPSAGLTTLQAVGSGHTQQAGSSGETAPVLPGIAGDPAPLHAPAASPPALPWTGAVCWASHRSPAVQTGWHCSSDTPAMLCFLVWLWGPTCAPQLSLALNPILEIHA